VTPTRLINAVDEPRQSFDRTTTTTGQQSVSDRPQCLIMFAATTTDHDVLDALRGGDQEAFELVYAQHARQVFGAALGVVFDRQIAEDVTQEVFVELWRHADRVDIDRGGLRSFLVTVAKRRAIDIVRSEERRRERQRRANDPTAWRFDEPDVAESIVAADAHRRSLEHMRGALGQLPEAERTSIELAYFRGCTLRQVAVVMNAPEGTAKSRVRRALRNLEGHMAASVRHDARLTA
jgi:RNA polymerase sigma-70 factor, ECF subfamily